MNVEKRLVSNYTSGRSGYKPEAFVIHIAEGSLKGAESWFNNPNSKASSHYMIGKEGQIVQFVEDLNTAWHAGGVEEPAWNKLKPNINPNLYTIGIEHEGFHDQVWTQATINSSVQLIASLCNKYNIIPNEETIIGHYQINSVSRSNCPAIDKSIITTIIKNVQSLFINNIQMNPNTLTKMVKIKNMQKLLIISYQKEGKLIYGFLNGKYFETTGSTEDEGLISIEQDALNEMIYLTTRGENFNDIWVGTTFDCVKWNWKLQDVNNKLQ